MQFTFYTQTDPPHIDSHQSSLINHQSDRNQADQSRGCSRRSRTEQSELCVCALRLRGVCFLGNRLVWVGYVSDVCPVGVALGARTGALARSLVQSCVERAKNACHPSHSQQSLRIRGDYLCLCCVTCGQQTYVRLWSLPQWGFASADGRAGLGLDVRPLRPQYTQKSHRLLLLQIFLTCLLNHHS